MLPSAYNCLGITYNKTLLEEHGWELPKSFADLEKTIRSIKFGGGVPNRRSLNSDKWKVTRHKSIKKDS